MEISAISSNSFKGNNNVIDVNPSDYTIMYPKKDFDIDKVDFKALATAVDKNQNADKNTSPVKFFLATGCLALASFVATKKVSSVALKTIESKLSLDKPMNKLGIKISKVVNKMKAHTPVEVKSVKTFFVNLKNKSLNSIGTTVENIGKKGITKEATEQFTKLMGKDAPIEGLYAKNALQRTIAGTLATGTAGATIASRYKDEDGNGIPDKAEKALGKFNDAKELLSGVAAACDIAG